MYGTHTYIWYAISGICHMQLQWLLQFWFQFHLHQEGKRIALNLAGEISLEFEIATPSCP